MKIVNVPNKEQTTYYCDRCKKILNENHSAHSKDERYDHIEETISYDKSFVDKRCSFHEEREIIMEEDLCYKCYNKKQKGYDKLVKSRTRAGRIRNRIIRFVSFSSPLLSIDIEFGRIRIKYKYTKCKCGLCFRNGKNNSMTKDRKALYYCDKHHKMLVDIFINNSTVGVNKYLMHNINKESLDKAKYKMQKAIKIHKNKNKIYSPTTELQSKSSHNNNIVI